MRRTCFLLGITLSVGVALGVLGTKLVSAQQQLAAGKVLQRIDVAGAKGSEAFRRYRNIYTLGIAHGLLGLALACSLPNDVHRHMRVGLGYLLYRPNPHASPPPLLRRKPR